MADRFIPLHEFVLPALEAQTEFVQPAVVIPSIDARPDFSEASADVRRFRAAVRDAVDVAVRDVLRDVVAEVLARELELASVNVDAIVARACARYASEEVVRVRVHPDEAERIESTNVDVVADAGLRRGDVLLEVRSGTIDVTLGARLADVLDGAMP